MRLPLGFVALLAGTALAGLASVAAELAAASEATLGCSTQTARECCDQSGTPCSHPGWTVALESQPVWIAMPGNSCRSNSGYVVLRDPDGDESARTWLDSLDTRIECGPGGVDVMFRDPWGWTPRQQSSADRWFERLCGGLAYDGFTPEACTRH